LGETTKKLQSGRKTTKRPMKEESTIEKETNKTDKDCNYIWL